MSRLDRSGVLNDYGIGAVMAFDETKKRNPSLPCGSGKRLATDRLLEQIDAEQERARHRRESNAAARAIPGYNRLP